MRNNDDFVKFYKSVRSILNSSVGTLGISGRKIRYGVFVSDVLCSLIGVNKFLIFSRVSLFKSDYDKCRDLLMEILDIKYNN